MPVNPTARCRRRQRKQQIVNGFNPVKLSTEWGTAWWHQLIAVELFIGCLIVIWYIWTYVYYFALYTAYKIPDFYIDITLLKLLKPSSRLVYAFTFYYIGLYYLYKKPRKIKYFIISLYFLIFSVLSIIPLKLPTEVLIQFLLFPLLSFVVIPYDFWKKTRDQKGLSIVERIKSYRIKEDKMIAVNEKKNLLSNIFTIIIISALPILPFFHGYFKAYSQTEFYVIEQKQSKNNQLIRKVIIDTYGDFYIVAPLNKDNKSYKPIFSLIPMYDKEKKTVDFLELKYEEIGPLKPQE
ncbi:hypothetical protein C1X05_00100 [Laceyella sacchari]|nr:hypothetical protein C1X05_00100 [Laceyella sacchari]